MGFDIGVWWLGGLMDRVGLEVVLRRLHMALKRIG